MVDDMKKQMRRFEHFIGFRGKLDVTSRDSMEELIKALSSKYKSDIQSSIRLHRLEFFYDLVQSKDRKKEKAPPVKKVATQDKKKAKKTEETEEPERVKEVPHEVVSVEAKDVDDWKNLMALSKIYYVLEHPRSVGLTWKRRIAKKKKIEKFGDRDLIEWRVAQNFRLRGLEEWAQSRYDARKMAERSGYLLDELDDSEEARELEDLLVTFDSSQGSSRTAEKKQATIKKPATDRPFKFKDESMEDWTESYSEDSEYSGAEDFVDEIEDFPDEMERKIGEVREAKQPPMEEDISDILSKYPKFSQYRSPIFEKMDEAQTLPEWYELYKKSLVDTPEEEKPPAAAMLDVIIEEDVKEETAAESLDDKAPEEEAVVRKIVAERISDVISELEDNLDETPVKEEDAEADRVIGDILKLLTEEISKPSIEEISKPSTEGTSKPIGESSTEGTSEPAGEPSTEGTSEPASESSTEGTSEPADESTEGASEPADESTEGASELADESTEDASEPADESTEGASELADESTEGALKPADESTEDASEPADESTEGASKPADESTEDASEPADESSAAVGDEPREDRDLSEERRVDEAEEIYDADIGESESEELTDTDATDKSGTEQESEEDGTDANEATS